MPFCAGCGKAYEGTPLFCPNCGKALQQPTAPTQSGGQSAQVVKPTTAKKSNTGRNIAIIILALIVIVVAVWFFSYSGYGNQLTYPNVSVTGQITTVGFGTTPFRVDFTSSSSGSVFSAAVSGGYYSVSLPNHDSYTVTVDYDTAISSTSTCNGGVLNLNLASSTDTFNTSC